MLRGQNGAKMRIYPKEFKEAIVQQVLLGKNMMQASRDAQIPYQTLNAWVNSAKGNSKKTAARPQNWSANQKFNAITETAKMSPVEISEYCRNQRIYSHNIEEWKKNCLEGIKTSSSKEKNEETNALKEENNKLKAEISRKDKALAEASALLVLKKKANLIWGTSEDD